VSDVPTAGPFAERVCQRGEPVTAAGRIRIAVAQTPVSTDPRENGATVRAAMRSAAAQGARLVHFCEGALGGYAGAAKQHFYGWRIDWQVAEAELRRTMQLAGELRLWVVVGGNHRLDYERPHNSLYIISDDGQLAGRYDKRYLSHSEIARLYTPGFTPCTFEVDSFVFGCLLCIEIQFGELWTQQRDLGVDCVLFSTYSEDPIFEVIARGYAAANSYWVSVAVPVPCSTAMPSALIGPHGLHLAQAPPDVPAVVCVDLDRADPALDIAVNHTRPWRRQAADGHLYLPYRSSNRRSSERTSI
jgi:predicted amidohydrolase